MMTTDKQKMLDAKALIMDKRYREARAILRTIDHPAARAWIEKIDLRINQTSPKRRQGKWLKIGAIIAGLLIIIVVALAQVRQNNLAAARVRTITDGYAFCDTVSNRDDVAKLNACVDGYVATYTP